MRTKTGDSYQTAQETVEERKTSLEKIVATQLLKLAMETDEGRKARLKKMVATTQLRLAPETETKEELDWNICQTTQSIYLTTYI